MLIKRTPNAIIVSATDTSPDFVQIGILGDVYLWKLGRPTRTIVVDKKPHDSYTVGELRALLDQLERLP